MTTLIAALFALVASAQDGAAPPPIERLKSPDPAVRKAAERELAEAGAKAVPGLRRALAREGDPIEPRVDALVRKLAASSWREREDAARSLVLLGRAARPRLSTHENAADVEVAWRVRAILAELKELEPAEAAGAAYADAAICRLLAAAGDGSSAGLMLGALKRLESVAPDAALDVRLSAVAALADLRASLSPEFVERAVEEGASLLKGPRPRRVAGPVVKALGRLKSGSAIPALTSVVEDGTVKDLHLKRCALASLAELDLPASMKHVIGALKHPEPYLREAARQVLALSGAPETGFDPSGDPGAAAVDARTRAWWESKYGRSWDADPR